MAAVVAGAIGLAMKKKKTTIKLSPDEIYYTQNSINRTWGMSTDHANESIYELLRKLQNGTIDVSDIPPIRVVKHSGKWYSLDNRRLYIFKLFGVKITCERCDELPHGRIYGKKDITIR